MLNETTTKKK